MPIYWTQATDLARQQATWVPAQEVWFDTRRLDGETQIVHPTTSGTALGGSREEAALFALLEAVERDSFLTTWYAQTPGRKVAPQSIDRPSFQVELARARLAFPDYGFHFFYLASAFGLPTVWAMAVRERGTGMKVLGATASGMTTAEAAQSALKEVVGFFPMNRRFEQERAQYETMDEHPELVRDIEHHLGLYGLDERFERLAFSGV